ncbi:MAG: hypothetical protein ACTTKH_05220 [Treponema sp.]
MGLKSEKTNWIFLLASKNEPEIRHIYDVKFGIDALISSGVAIENITVIIDSSEPSTLKIIKETDSFTNKSIYKSSELKELFKKNNYDNIVLFVNGHGGYRGLDANSKITPSYLLNSLQNANHLKRGIVFLGQCFAGIFNYMPVMKSEKDGKQLPPIILIGSTGLRSSLSSIYVVKEKTEEYPYQINIFFYYLFEWIKKPEDIDGDGKCSLIDAYKYVGYNIIKFSSYQKINNLIKKKQDEYRFCKEIKKIKNKNMSDKEKKAIETTIIALKEKLLSYEYNQEPWILNAIEAMNVYL